MSNRDTRNQMYILESRDLMSHECFLPGTDLVTMECAEFDWATQKGWQAYCRYSRKYENDPYHNHPATKPSQHRVHRRKR